MSSEKRKRTWTYRVLNPTILENCIAFLRKLSFVDDTWYTVVIKVGEDARSERQNRYLWGVVYRELSEYTGYRPAELHEVYKNRFIHDHEVKTVELDGKTYRIRTTKTFTVGRMKDFIDDVVRDASELGVYIPEPGERI